MARWQRDPRKRRNVAIVVAILEVLTATGLFYPLFFNYYVRVAMRVSMTLQVHAVAVVRVATVVAFLWFGLQAVAYVKGRAWARWGFIGVNVAMVLAGLLWWVLDMMSASPDPAAAWWGLVMPLATAFPMVGLLLGFQGVQPSQG